jgi:DNA-binding response OmpR family regulator
MQSFLSPGLSTITLSCLGGLCRVWRGLLPGRGHDHRRITIADSELHVEHAETRFRLTDNERVLLAFLLENPGAVFTPEVILSRLWWPDLKQDRDFVDATVASLNVLLYRAGLGKTMIESFHGVGYRLKPADETK